MVYHQTLLFLVENATTFTKLCRLYGVQRCTFTEFGEKQGLFANNAEYIWAHVDVFNPVLCQKCMFLSQSTNKLQGSSVNI